MTPVRFRPGPLPAEAYEAPSGEVMRLVRGPRWLTSPPDGRSGLVGRAALHGLIAPMTQLTFLNFDLQMFLFLVFHRSFVSRAGHGLFMATENLFLMAALRELPLAGPVDAGLVHAVVLAVWYGVVARRAGLPAWYALTLPLLGVLYAASGPVGALCRSALGVSPAWLALGSAALVALSHAAEPHLPPRTADPWRWVLISDYMGEPGIGWARRAGRALRLVSLSLIGTVAEAWAGLRLMPYNWLVLMMRAGYAPARWAALQDHAERAWATGQPALDYVGTGGGTFLDADALPPPHR